MLFAVRKIRISNTLYSYDVIVPRFLSHCTVTSNKFLHYTNTNEISRKMFYKTYATYE